MRPLFLALSGRGGHAASHAGALLALEKAGIPVAGVAAVSGGALVAAAWAGGGDLRALVEKASNLHPWTWVRGWGGGLLSGTRLGVMIDEFLPATTFEGLRVPLAVVCTDVDTGQPVVFRTGELRDVVRASCSFPGVFPPIEVASRRLYDGGVSEGGAGASRPGDGRGDGRGGGLRLQLGHALARGGLVRGAGPARQGLVALAAIAVAVGLLAVSGEHPAPGVGSWLEAQGLVPLEREVAGLRVRYVRAGQGSPVVRIHGLASSIYTWKDVLPRLAASHDVVALDLPGFGGSEQPPDLGFGDLVAAVPALLDALGLERASLVGNSLGGAVAAWVAAHDPDRVPALVLVDAVGFQDGDRDLPAPFRLAVADPTGLLARTPVKRPIVRLALRQVFHDDRLVTDERVAEHVAPLLRPGAMDSLGSLLRTPSTRLSPLQESQHGIRAATLVVWGAEDTWIPVEHAERFASAIPDARVERVESCGHMPQEECPEALLAVLGPFLEAHAARP